MHSAAARVETLRSAERPLYQAVKLSRAVPLKREPAFKTAASPDARKSSSTAAPRRRFSDTRRTKSLFALP